MRAGSRKTWTAAEAEARLSEILRLAREEGPKRLGANPRYVVATEEEWLERAEPERPPPFSDWELHKGPDGK